jgi:hypothetical protein
MNRNLEQSKENLESEKEELSNQVKKTRIFVEVIGSRFTTFTQENQPRKPKKD